MRTIFFIACILTANLCLAQISGCTDPQSLNYNPLASINDGSCAYPPTTAVFSSSQNLPVALNETSGLTSFNGSLLTHNDNNDNTLYEIDQQTGNIGQTYNVPGQPAIDWEEITQDDDYLYIGDFGNNSHGNRTDLKILRILKESLGAEPEVDTIYFSYENQSSFLPAQANATNFDCEAFVVSGDHIYLFTKQWLAAGTSIYKLPKQPGTYVAQQLASHNVDGLITGATQIADKKIIALSGYDNLLKPFIYLLYDYEGDDFFSGNKRKIKLPNSGYQVEGISTTDGLHYYLTNERFILAPYLNVAPKLLAVDLSAYLGNYINLSVQTAAFTNKKPLVIFDAIANQLSIDCTTIGVNIPYTLFDSHGIAVKSGILADPVSNIPTDDIALGIYYLRAGINGELIKGVRIN
jgi:hypothetical protein